MLERFTFLESRRLGLCQAPEVTTAHRLLALASLLGAAFVVLHLITIIVTCAVKGTDWGTAAWCLDLTGFFAGFAFVFVCRKCSSASSAAGKQDNTWICVWALATFGSRILDTLMLFGVVKLDAVYKTPDGAVLAVNVVSEVVIGNLYCIVALVGALDMLCCPTDIKAGGATDVVTAQPGAVAAPSPKV